MCSLTCWWGTLSTFLRDGVCQSGQPLVQVRVAQVFDVVVERHDGIHLRVCQMVAIRGQSNSGVLVGVLPELLVPPRPVHQAHNHLVVVVIVFHIASFPRRSLPKYTMPTDGGLPFTHIGSSFRTTTLSVAQRLSGIPTLARRDESGMNPADVSPTSSAPSSEERLWATSWPTARELALSPFANPLVHRNSSEEITMTTTELFDSSAYSPPIVPSPEHPVRGAPPVASLTSCNRDC